MCPTYHHPRTACPLVRQEDGAAAQASLGRQLVCLIGAAGIAGLGTGWRLTCSKKCLEGTYSRFHASGFYFKPT